MEHFNTAPDFPQSKAEVDALDDEALEVFMGMCEAEPAEPDSCLACYAYMVSQDRDEKAAPRDELLGKMAQRVQPIAHDFTRNMGYIAPEELPQRVANLIFQVVSLCAAVAKEAQDA